MANFPGGSGAAPGVYADIQTLTSGVSVPGGIRIAAILGEGSRSEVVVSSALGGGTDGLNASYTSTSGADGRHFALSAVPLQPGRTKLYKNGVLLVGKEELIDSSSFDNSYDYRVDSATGHIELQKAHLVDQGGAFYTKSSTNYGTGAIQNLSVLDANAPTETWTIKCVSVQRDGYGVPMTGTAKFLAFGTVSGVKLDGYGNPVTWLSDNTIVSNGTIQFSVYQDPSLSSNNFKEGDAFTVKVASGVLLRNDSLLANYICTTDLNDPTFYDDLDDIKARFGAASTDNNLTLGAQLAFANGTPGVVCLQTAPALPRRLSYDLRTAVESTSTDVEDYIFPLPAGVTPDANSNIHFFITNPTTGVETQIIPNKTDFGVVTDTSTTPTLNTFVFSTSTYAYHYTVMDRSLAIKFGTNGVLTADATIPGKAALTSDSFLFQATDVGKKVKIFDATNATNKGTFDAIADVNGALTITQSAFAAESTVSVTLKNSSGATIASFSDGVIAPNNSDTTKATLTSATTDFSIIPSITTLHAVITVASSAGNIGTFLISAVTVGNNNQITIKKFFVDESALTFEVLDTDQTGSFVVVNQSVVPAGYSLRVSVIDENDATFFDAGWVSALAALEIVDVDIVVPLPKQTPSAIFQNALAHCRKMSQIKNKRERVLFTGAIQGLTPDNVTGVKPAAVEDIGILEGIQGDTVTEVLAGTTEDLTDYSVSAAFGNTFRCSYLYPDQIIVQAGADRVAIDGFYMAAAAAGYVSGINNIAVPLTNKVLSGFTILRTKRFSPTVIEKLLAAGIAVVQPVQGGGVVIHGRTTTQSGFPEEEELSIVFIRDRIAKSMRAGFSGFVGTEESDTTDASMTARAIGLLNSFVAQNIITAFSDLKVARDKVEPRQRNVSVRVQPNYATNWIYIKVNVGTI